MTACLALSGAACGSAQTPADQDIWYDEALRPGRLEPASEGEGELLSRLSDLPAGQPVTLHGEVFVPDAAYDAASGRSCRRVAVQGEPPRDKLACEEGAGEWVFVPDVFAEGPGR